MCREHDFSLIRLYKLYVLNLYVSVQCVKTIKAKTRQFCLVRVGGVNKLLYIDTETVFIWRCYTIVRDVSYCSLTGADRRSTTRTDTCTSNVASFCSTPHCRHLLPDVATVVRCCCLSSDTSTRPSDELVSCRTTLFPVSSWSSCFTFVHPRTFYTPQRTFTAPCHRVTFTSVT